MQDQLLDALKGHGAHYVEARLEQSEGAHMLYRGKLLEEVSKSSGAGGNARALAGGGWGLTCFNDVSDLKGKVATAVGHAHHVGGDRVALADIETHVEKVAAVLGEDPMAVSLAEKKRILDEYAEIMLGVPGVQTCVVNYNDWGRKMAFATSQGAYIEQERIDVTLRLSAMARDGGEVQQAGVSIGSLGDFSFVRSLHEEAERQARRAVELLHAPKVKGGEYTVVLDPVLAGVFIHEAFGHLSEADHVYENDHMREIMYMGRRFGGPHLNVVDGAALPGLRGSYKYDDEGTPAARTDLIREGVLVGRLHSRETAAKMGEKPSGNARAINYQFPPIVRMTNTFIEQGDVTFQEMIADIKEGVYARNWFGGMTSMEMFTFSAGEAFMIRNGQIAELLRPVMLTGNLFTTLQNLDLVANDLEMNQGGGCGKNGQFPLPVSNGSPHIRIQRCLVGGG